MRFYKIASARTTSIGWQPEADWELERCSTLCWTARTGDERTTMDTLLKLLTLAVLGGICLRCFHEISSFADDGPNRYDRPAMVAQRPWLATLGGIMILPTIVSLGVAGYRISGWLAALLLPILTLSIVVPIAYSVLRSRTSVASLYFGNPFFLLVPFFPARLHSPSVGERAQPMSGRKPLQDARHMTLGVHGAWDVYRKLLWEVETFKQSAARKVPIGEAAAVEIRFPMYAALNAAATAWSLVEWFWFEVEHQPENRSRLLIWAGVDDRGEVLKRLKAAFRKKVAEIEACNQIAHATKHAQLHDITPGFSTPVSYDFWQSAGWLYSSTKGHASFVDGDGGIPLEDLFERVVSWWKETLSSYSIPDRLHLIPGDPTAR